MNLNAFLDLARENPEVSLTAFGATVAVILGTDIWVTWRRRQRTLLGRIIGYAPKRVSTGDTKGPSIEKKPRGDVASEDIARENDSRVRTEIAVLLHRLDQLEAMNAGQKSAEEISELKRENRELRREVEELKTVYVAGEARRLARQGMSALDISETFGLTLDEAKAVCATAH